jgi:hypothetical protein
MFPSQKGVKISKKKSTLVLFLSRHSGYTPTCLLAAVAAAFYNKTELPGG